MIKVNRTSVLHRWPCGTMCRRLCATAACPCCRSARRIKSGSKRYAHAGHALADQCMRAEEKPRYTVRTCARSDLKQLQIAPQLLTSCSCSPVNTSIQQSKSMADPNKTDQQCPQHLVSQTRRFQESSCFAGQRWHSTFCKSKTRCTQPTHARMAQHAVNQCNTILFPNTTAKHNTHSAARLNAYPGAHRLLLSPSLTRNRPPATLHTC